MITRRILIPIVCCLAVSHALGYPPCAAETDPVEGDVTWEALLQKAREKNPSGTAVQEAPRPTAEEVEREWKEALRGIEGARRESRSPETVKTFYKNGGMLQSERFFSEGEIRRMKWYSMDGVLIFDGTFENGKLVARKRFSPAGELESVWEAE